MQRTFPQIQSPVTGFPACTCAAGARSKFHDYLMVPVQVRQYEEGFTPCPVYTHFRSVVSGLPKDVSVYGCVPNVPKLTFVEQVEYAFAMSFSYSLSLYGILYKCFVRRKT